MDKRHLVKALLGDGMASSAAEDLKLKPQYDRAVIDGEIDPSATPYEAWKAMQTRRGS